MNTETDPAPSILRVGETQRAYEYLPAGLYMGSHAGLAIYIRYESNPKEIRLIESSSRHNIIRCPDRTLYVVSDKHLAEPWPVDFSFDEMVSPTPFWPRTGIQTGVKQYMQNYTQYADKENESPRARANGRLPEHNQILFADSGGFQIQSEILDYISPERLIGWYNANVDVGAVLDFPPKNIYWPGLIEQMAEAQARSTETLMRLKRPDLELMNVVHGEAVEDVRTFRSIVERPDINRLAIGGAYFSSIMKSIDHAARIMLEGRRYGHYHMLGVSNIKQLYPLMRMATKGIAEYITTDSSTFLNEAFNKGYYVWPAVDAPPRYYKIGDKTNRPNAGKILPCSCHVCAAIKYADVFSVLSGNTLTFMLMLHNMQAFLSLTEAMHDIIRDASLKDLKTLLRSQLATRAHARDEVLSTLDYVDEVAANGLDAGASKVAYFLHSGASEPTRMRTLFSNNARNIEDEEEQVMSEDDPHRQRMTRILETYISLKQPEPGDAAAPLTEHVRVKKKERMREKGHAKSSAGGVRIPGQRKVVRKKKEPKVERAKIVPVTRVIHETRPKPVKGEGTAPERQRGVGLGKAVKTGGGRMGRMAK